MRWVLSLWCVFLLSTGALAHNTLRFVVKDARTRQPLSGATVYFCTADDDERQLQTDPQGRAEFHKVSTFPLRFEVRALIHGIGYKSKIGKLSLEQNQTIEVRLTLLPDLRGEVIQAVRWKRWMTNPWMTIDHEGRSLVEGGWQEPTLPAPGKLTFQVRDAVTGKPLPYVPVLLKGPEITEPVGEEDMDEDGNAIRETPPGTYHYAVVAFINGVFYERLRGEVTVVSGKEAKVTVNLQPSGRNIPSMR